MFNFIRRFIKKRFFKRMLRRTLAEIWDTEFNRFTAIYERESTRQQYDQASDVVHRLEAQKDEEKLTIAKKTVDQLKANMDEFDAILQGAIPSEEYPQGRVGLDQRLENLMKRKANIEAFMKHYC